MSRRALRLLLFVAGLSALLVLAWAARDSLAQLPGQLNLPRFGVALISGLVFLVLQGTVYALLMRKNGVAVAPSRLIAVFLWSQPGKYLPGRIWSPAIQAAELGYAHNFGATVMANIELTLLGALQSLALGSALALRDMPAASLAVLAASLAAATLLTQQQKLGQLLHALRKRLRWLPEITIAAAVPGPRLVGCAALSAATLALNLITSASIVLAYDALPSDAAIPLLCALYLGWTASYLALPVPAGIGVREASTVAFAGWLAPQVSLEAVVTITLIARVWQIAVDVLAVSLAGICKLFSSD